MGKAFQRSQFPDRVKELGLLPRQIEYGMAMIHDVISPSLW